MKKTAIFHCPPRILAAVYAALPSIKKNTSPTTAMTSRTPDDVRAEFKRKGVSISSWAIANGYSTNLVFEVIAGRKKCLRGQAHNIAVALGLKEGEICKNPATALQQAA